MGMNLDVFLEKVERNVPDHNFLERLRYKIQDPAFVQLILHHPAESIRRKR